MEVLLTAMVTKKSCNHPERFVTNVLAGVPSINPPIIQVPRTMSRGGLSLGQPALCIRLQRILRAIGSIQAKPTVSYRNCS